MQVAVSTLLRRLPGLRLAAEKQEYRPTYVIRGLKELPVEWEERAVRTASP
jgi:cytochrome P450